MAFTINHNLMAASVSRNLEAHYSRLSVSTQRLSSGLRINGSSDDAAGLAIRELQRADIAALQQGARNANDAISLLQTADGALAIIDEKLIRMKELAEQAATGTYDSTQRLMIESEYQAMASEISRIANATDFNGIKLLDGSLSGAHDGSGLVSQGKLKVHFGSGNDSAEDYYYINIGNCSAAALGIGNQATRPVTKTVFLSPGGEELAAKPGIVTLDGVPYTPAKGDDLIKPVYTDGTPDTGQYADGGPLLLIEHPAPGEYASIKYGWDHSPQGPLQQYMVEYDGKKVPAYADNGGDFPLELLALGTVYEDANGRIYGEADIIRKEVPTGAIEYADAFTVSTQDAAQRALTGINAAIVSKDKIRAHLGALQNRLENTISNLTIQQENLQAAESRISDVDVATEMTNFVRNQILSQSAVAMLSQANSLPQAALQLIGG